MRTALAAALLVLVAGCGETTEDEPRVLDSVNPDASTTEAPAFDSITDICEDAKGDGKGVDMVKASLTVVDEVLLEIQLAKPVPQTDTAMVGINVASADGEKSKQLAAKWIDGKSGAPFVFDMGTAQQENLDSGDQVVSGSDLTLTFPLSSVEDLGDGWTWYAFTTEAGQDVDACPGEVMSFEKRVFPSN